MCNAANDSLIVRMLIQFPVIMWHIHFRCLLILSVTFDDNSHQWGKWVYYILSDGFEIVFRLYFRFGNNWLVLYSSSSNWQSGICLQNLCFGAGNNKFGIPLWILLMAVNLTSFCPLLLTSLKLASIRWHVFCMEIIWLAKWAWAELNKLYTELYIWSAVCTALNSWLEQAWP
jgi:hypothetical protein